MMPLANLPFSPVEKQIIHHRTSVMARHMSPHVADSTMHAAMSPLNVQNTGTPLRAGANWANEFSSQRNLNMEFERAFSVHAPPPPQSLAGGWTQEFVTQQSGTEQFEKEWSVIAQQHNIPTTTGEQWANEFESEVAEREAQKERAMSEEERSLRAEEEQWFSQFLPEGAVKSQLAQEWVGEFSGTKDRDWSEEFMEGRGGPRANMQAARMRHGPPGSDLGGNWAAEFGAASGSEHSTGGRGRGAGSGAGNLVDSVSNISDPRLKNSQFMKFIEQVNDGKIQFKDNQVINT